MLRQLRVLILTYEGQLNIQRVCVTRSSGSSSQSLDVIRLGTGCGEHCTLWGFIFKRLSS